MPQQVVLLRFLHCDLSEFVFDKTEKKVYSMDILF